MKQARSFVTASDICHQLDPTSKKRKSEKIAETRERTSNQNATPRRGPNRPEGERKYPPRELKDDGFEARFNCNRRDIFYAIRDELPTPAAISMPQYRRNMELWCEYHKEHAILSQTAVNLKESFTVILQEGDIV
jgi:hypothetical protein